MSINSVSEDIKYIGVFDDDIDLFEGQYTVPEGISYNSYVIMDEKITVMDTADKRKTAEWLSNLKSALDGKKPSYLVVSHMEPDHSASISAFLKEYPDTAIVGNAKTFLFLNQFFKRPQQENDVVVKEGDSLSIGKHTLNFYMAPMVHWPEVMVTYESTEKVIFTADAFGKFGKMVYGDQWDDEGGRYFMNICGKYGVQVQALLKKAAALDIKTICPLHGPVLKEDLGHYISLYDTWSSYRPEKEGTVIAYTSIYGNTKAAVMLLKEKLEALGKPVETYDLARNDVSLPLFRSFRFSNLVVASTTYDGGLFPKCEDFLVHLKAKNFSGRRVAIIENGTWAPMAGKHMEAKFAEMKNIEMIRPVITIKSSMTDKNMEEIEELANLL